MHNIIANDNFDVEAYCELIKNDIELLKQNNYDPYISTCNPNYNKDYASYFNELVDTYDRLIKIDSNDETYKTYLSNYMDDISNYLQINTERKQVENLSADILKQLQDDRGNAYRVGCGDEYEQAVRDAFKLKKAFYYQKKAMPIFTDSAGYMYSSIKDIYTDGTFLASYSKMLGSYESGYFHDYKNLYFNPVEFAKNYNELEERFNKYKEILNPIYEVAKVKYEKKEKIKKIFGIVTKVIIAIIALIIILKIFGH